MIKILDADIREALENALGRKATPEEMAEFRTFASNDTYEWLKDNAKSFARKE